MNAQLAFVSLSLWMWLKPVSLHLDLSSTKQFFGVNVRQSCCGGKPLHFFGGLKSLFYEHCSHEKDFAEKQMRAVAHKPHQHWSDPTSFTTSISLWSGWQPPHLVLHLWNGICSSIYLMQFHLSIGLSFCKQPTWHFSSSSKFSVGDREYFCITGLWLLSWSILLNIAFSLCIVSASVPLHLFSYFLKSLALAFPGL